MRTEVEWVDVVAQRDGVQLICEAKGRTGDPGIDLDTAYGQLLRRMPVEDDPAIRFGLVVRDEPRSIRAALRVEQRCGVRPARPVGVAGSGARLGMLDRAVLAGSVSWS